MQNDTNQLHGLRVLAAEDDALNQMLLSDCLSHFGMTCVCTADGKACLDTLENGSASSFDVVLMDIQMPHMNGLETTEKIRSHTREEIRSLPVIAMTADTAPEEIAAYRASGMNGVIAKPIDLHAMHAEIRRVLTDCGRIEHSSSDTCAGSSGSCTADKNEESSEYCTSDKNEESSESCASGKRAASPKDSSNSIFCPEALITLLSDQKAALAILQSFLSVHGNDCTQLQTLIKEGRYYEARQILHNLIGVSGSFFMHRLCKAAGQLGADLRAEHAESLPDFVTIWDQTLARVTKVHDAWKAM